MQMSFNLDALFHEPVELYEEVQSLTLQSEVAPVTKASEAFWVAGVDEDEVVAKERKDVDVRAIITSLSKERDVWKARAENQEVTIAELDRRVSKDLAKSDLPTDVVRRLNRLESEITRLRSENSHLKEHLQATEYEKVNLSNQNDGKAKKLKGANKKVKNAKEVAGKEEDKAKDAVGDKQRHLASERKMKKERNDALAALREQEKINADLQVELDIERQGAPHMRGVATDPNNTIAVIPIEFEIRRIDVQPTMMTLEANQMQITENFKRWYKEWKKPKEAVKKVVGANYLDDEKRKAKIYEDMIEMPDGYMETGAEHDGWRSKRAMEAVCRHAEARYNEES
jgi:chromosome segregation ATPase